MKVRRLPTFAYSRYPQQVGVAVIVRVAAGAVAVVRVAVDHFRLGWGAAAVDRYAVGYLHLDGGVVDAEMVAQAGGLRAPVE